MNAALLLLLKHLEKGQLLATPLLHSDAIDAAIEDRHGAPFDSEWLRVGHLLSKVDMRENAPTVSQIRELSFKAVYRTSNHPDMAAYVSDDFELISRALISGLNDPWLNGVFSDYASSRFPRGRIPDTSESIAERLRA